MKTIQYILLFLLLLCMINPIHGQENTAIAERQPEQEAIKQTEKLQRELNLNSAQTRQIFEINLRYARARQVSNTRSEAMERIKNKNADIEKVLSEEQKNRLQNKRYEHRTSETSSMPRSQSVSLPTLQFTIEYRPGQVIRATSSDVNVPTNYRTGNRSLQTSPQVESSAGKSATSSSRNNPPPTTVTPTDRPQSAAPLPANKTTTPSNTNRK